MNEFHIVRTEEGAYRLVEWEKLPDSEARTIVNIWESEDFRTIADTLLDRGPDRTLRTRRVKPRS